MTEKGRLQTKPGDDTRGGAEAAWYAAREDQSIAELQARVQRLLDAGNRLADELSGQLFARGYKAEDVFEVSAWREWRAVAEGKGDG